MGDFGYHLSSTQDRPEGANNHSFKLGRLSGQMLVWPPGQDHTLVILSAPVAGSAPLPYLWLDKFQIFKVLSVF